MMIQNVFLFLFSLLIIYMLIICNIFEEPNYINYKMENINSKNINLKTIEPMIANFKINIIRNPIRYKNNKKRKLKQKK